MKKYSFTNASGEKCIVHISNGIITRFEGSTNPTLVGHWMGKRFASLDNSYELFPWTEEQVANKYRVTFTLNGKLRGYVWEQNGTITRLERDPGVLEATGFTPEKYVGQSLSRLTLLYTLQLVEVGNPSESTMDRIQRSLANYRENIEHCLQVNRKIPLGDANPGDIKQMFLNKGKLLALEDILNILNSAVGGE